VDPKAAAAIVRTAHRDGARVIAYDTPIASRNLDLYDGYDDRAIGRAQAGWLVAHAHRKGSIVMINGARSNPQAQLLHQGAYQVLGPRFRSGYFKMGGDFWTASGTATEAKRALDRYLHAHHNLVQGVLAADDELATGAQYSLGDVGLLGRTPLTGEDATVVALRRILTGDQGMTVYKPFTPEADAAAAAAAAFLHHKPVPRLFNKRVTVPGGSVRAALLSPMVITRSNVDRVLQDGVVTKKQVCAGLPKQTCGSL
jgi:D-xylose transport system substrate-binding protein